MNIPGEAQNTEYILFFCSQLFEKAGADVEKDQSHSRKRALAGKRMYCSYPSHEVTSKGEIQKLCTDIEAIGQEKYMSLLLRGSDYEP